MGCIHKLRIKQGCIWETIMPAADAVKGIPLCLERKIEEVKEDMAQTDKEFIDFIMRERMQLHYARMKENQGLDAEDEEGLEAERKCREVLSRLAKEDQMCIELYHEAMVHNFARENEFFYLTGVKDGYMLRAYLEKHMNIAG